MKSITLKPGVHTLWQEHYDGKIYIIITETKADGSIQHYFSINNKATFTVTEGSSYLIGVRTHTKDAVGTLANYKNRFMIYEGTEEKPYEPYGAMPSPEYPSPIRNVGDNVQLFDKDDENIQNGYLNANGTVVANDTYRVSDFIKILNMKNLTISGNYGGSEIICFYNSSKTFLSSINMLTNKIKTFDIPNEAHYIRITLHKTVLNTYKLEQGTQATPYTKFGCGSADIKVQNKNVWIPTLQNNGIDITKVNCNVELIDDIYKFTATGTDIYLGELPIVIGTNYIPKIGTLYEIGKHTVLSVLITNEQFTKNFITFYGKDKKTISNKQKQTNKFKEDIPENAKYFSLRFGKSNATIGETYETKVDIRFDEDLIEDYVKHEEQTLHFQLAKVLHKEDYLADDGIHYKRKTIIFDGTEAWFKSSTALVNRFGLTTSKVNNFKGINSDNTLCTHFKYDERNRITINAYHFLNSNALYFDTDMENVTTLEEWKSYLAEQYANGTPVTLEYGLVEEIVEAYTSEQQEAYNKLKELYSYEDVTHITCENDINCNFNVEYFKDYNILRQNDKQELQAQIDEIKASLVSEVSE